MSNLSKFTIAILAGGMGTRFQPVIKDSSKVIAEVGNRFFIEYLLDPDQVQLENEFYTDAINLIRAVEKKLKLKEMDLSREMFYSYENKFKGPF